METGTLITATRRTAWSNGSMLQSLLPTSGEIILPQHKWQLYLHGADFDFVNNFCYCWLKTGSVGDGLTIFSTPCAVVSKNRLKFRRKRKRLRNGARWLPASLLLRNIVYNEFDFLLNSSVKCSSSDVFGLFSWFSMLQQNCRQSFIMLSNILDTEPMSKNDCEIKADKYSWWKPTSSVKSWESRIWACKTFHWDSITSTWI